MFRGSSLWFLVSSLGFRISGFGVRGWVRPLAEEEHVLGFEFRVSGLCFIWLMV